MGRKNKAYSKDLHQQAYDRLTGMQTFGESKKVAMANGTSQEKIFSIGTYKTYWKHVKYFLAYIKEHHPECTTLKSAKKYVNEWLQSRVDQGLSAWTIQTEAKAVGKLYGITPEDKDYFTPPGHHPEPGGACAGSPLFQNQQRRADPLLPGDGPSEEGAGKPEGERPGYTGADRGGNLPDRKPPGEREDAGC